MTTSTAQHRATTAFGLDFGTTNSAIASARPGSAPRLAHFATPTGDATSTFRSVVFFPSPDEDDTTPVAGPYAIARYLDGTEGRLVQSAKSYLASALFKATQIHGRTTTLEEIIAGILRPLREQAEAELGGVGRDHTLVVGRPVRYANSRDDGEDADATSEDEERALERMRSALQLAGFEAEPRFEFEPVAAAWGYEQQLDHDELVLIADFGGGTSDFTLAGVGPSRRSRSDTVLATEGVGVAGDAFDSELVSGLIAPRMGQGGHYLADFTEQRMPIPSWIYGKLRRWHHLSFLRSASTMHSLEQLCRQAEHPEQLELLMHVVEAELGFRMYRSVEQTKVELSDRESTRLVFDAEIERLEAEVDVSHFEDWIARHLAAIGAAVDRLLATTGLSPGDVDRVFLTGGSSLVPAVRRIFARRFGESKLRGGDELTTVARGLALSGLRD